MHKNLLKLFRQLIKLASVETPEAVLYYDGELEVGTEVFVEDENGELVPATNGEYGNIIVEDGKVSAIKEEVVIEEPIKQAEEPVVEPTVDEEKEALKAKITELEAIIAEKDAIIAELEAKLAQIEEAKVEEEFNSLKPASKEIKDVVVSDKGALKYFQN